MFQLSDEITFFGRNYRSIFTWNIGQDRPKKIAIYFNLLLAYTTTENTAETGSFLRPIFRSKHFSISADSSPLLSSLTFSKWSKKETRTSLLLLRSKWTKFTHLLRPNLQRFKLLTVVVFFRVIISSVGLASQTCLRLTRLQAHIIVKCPSLTC